MKSLMNLIIFLIYGTKVTQCCKFKTIGASIRKKNVEGGFSKWPMVEGSP